MDIEKIYELIEETERLNNEYYWMRRERKRDYRKRI